MKFTFAILAVLLASVSATPVLETRNDLAIIERSSNHPKRGAAFNAAGAVSPLASNVAWAYDWSPAPIGSIPAGVEFVPMLWGTDANHISGWSTLVNNALNAGATHILGFNEPDNSGQSNMSPQAAAAAWKANIQPYGKRAKLVSPAVTNGAAPMGLAWLDSFFAACTGCQIDAVAIHIYDSATNIAYFKNYISAVSARYGNRPVWVTEFRGSGSVADETNFIKTMIPFLANLQSVERYAYFGDINGILIDGNNQLTALGQAYATS